MQLLLSTISSQCFSENHFKLNNHSSIPTGLLSYTWSFGDSMLSKDTGVVIHSYKYVKNYEIKLTALSDYGCADTFSRTVVVRPSPNSSFTANDTTQCLKANKLVFTNTSNIYKNTPLSYKWYFGSGDSSTLKSPVYSYKTANSFNIKLITTSNLGCIDTFSRTAIIYPQANPVFSVNDSVQCLKGNSFSFSDQTASFPTINNRLWKFGDSKTDTSLSALHQFLASGTFPVSLITTTSDGCKDTAKKNVFVNPAPDTAITVNAIVQCLKGNNFSFVAKKGSTVYGWDFGDGKSDTGRTINHSFSNPGTYLVKLFLSGSNGCLDTGMKTVIVHPSPDPAFTVSDSILCFKNNSFTFTANQPAFSYSWSLGDGNINSGSSIVHKYLSAGTFSLKLVVANNLACRDSMMKNIVVNPSPDAAFSINDSMQCLKGNSFVFSNFKQSFISSRQWWFGDLTTDTGISVIHQYSNSGSFPVKLLVTNAFNCFDSANKNVIVQPAPDATFTINDSVQCLKGNSFVFNCGQTALNYIWNCGDGFTTTLNLFNHSYLDHRYLQSKTESDEQLQLFLILR